MITLVIFFIDWLIIFSIEPNLIVFCLFVFVFNRTYNEVDNAGYSIGHFESLHGKINFSFVTGFQTYEGVFIFVQIKKNEIM